MAELRCAKCGTLNRVRRYSFREIPQCGSCHKSLPEAPVLKVIRGMYRWRRYFAWPAVVAVALLFFAWAGSRPPTAPATLTTPTVAPGTNIAAPGVCSAQPRPITGDYLVTDFADRVAPFEVHTQSGLDYLIKLQRSDQQTSALWFYVIGGMELQTMVPLGTYVLKYVAGKRWCGLRLYFGNNNAQRADTLLTFSEDYAGVNGHTITLYGVPHGNFDTATIPLSEF